MITKPKDRITTPQAFVIVVNFILGTSILTLPRASVEKVKTPDRCLDKCNNKEIEELSLTSDIALVKNQQLRKRLRKKKGAILKETL